MPLRHHEMGGQLERLDGDLDRWRAWRARDGQRSEPFPAAPVDVSPSLEAALEDQAEEPLVCFGAAITHDLAVLLEPVGVPPSAALREVEASFGGLVARWLRVGPFQMLRNPDHAGRRWVETDAGRALLVGPMPETLLFMAEDGSLWRRRSHVDDETPRRVATNLRGWLERAARVHQICEQSAISLRFGHVDFDVLARLLKAEPVAEAPGLFGSENAVLFTGPDPFDASGGYEATVYATRTEVAAEVVLQRAGAVRLSSAPWPSMAAPVPQSPLVDAMPPGLAAMRRRRSPVVQRDYAAAEEAPAWADGQLSYRAGRRSEGSGTGSKADWSSSEVETTA